MADIHKAKKKEKDLKKSFFKAKWMDKSTVLVGDFFFF